MRKRPKINDYGLIGNSHSAALISRNGSMDWLCWPRFDSPSLFSALLDSNIGGRWSISPERVETISRRYLPQTAILETTFHQNGGQLVLTDLMPKFTPEERSTYLLPEHEILRVVECREQPITALVVFHPRHWYGSEPVSLTFEPRRGLFTEVQGHCLFLRSSISDWQIEQGQATAKLSLQPGDRCYFNLSYARDAPAVLPAVGAWSEKEVQKTIQWWKNWAEQLQYTGRYRDELIRSLITLKLLTYAPSGAVVAAPTTSLPEKIGGELNWDYRFCWLRDASFTVRAFYESGFQQEAEAFVQWLIHATRLTRPRVQVLYDVYGRTFAKETELDHLSGFRKSRPVRIGNAAAEQQQHDVYGELMDAVFQIFQRAEKLDRDTQALLCDLGRYVCKHWQDKDAGIWEPRGPNQHYTHSLVLQWTALDRLISLAESDRLPAAPVEQFKASRKQIKDMVIERCFDSKAGSYGRSVQDSEVDAALILLCWYGFEDHDSSRMDGTFKRICMDLQAEPGLFYRNKDYEEGAFLVCSFWIVEYLACCGKQQEAELLFEKALSYANDLGLFAEEIEPSSGESLGNFPLALTHVGFINALLALTQEKDK